MGTLMWETTDSPAKIIQDEMRPFDVRMFTTDREAAAVAVVIPIDDDNRAVLRRIYAVPADATSVTMGFIVKHDGTLHWHRPGTYRTVSVKTMSEDMGPNYTGGATPQLMLTLTPLLPRPADKNEASGLAWAHEWRERCGLVLTGRPAA